MCVCMMLLESCESVSDPGLNKGWGAKPSKSWRRANQWLALAGVVDSKPCWKGTGTLLLARHLLMLGAHSSGLCAACKGGNPNSV